MSLGDSIGVAVIDGESSLGCARCANGRARWMVGPDALGVVAAHCNGCLVRQLNEMYFRALDYRPRGKALEHRGLREESDLLPSAERVG